MPRTVKLTSMEAAALDLVRMQPGLVIPIANRAKLRVFQRLRDKGVAVYRHGWYAIDEAPPVCEVVPVRPSWHPLPGSKKAGYHA